MLGKRGHEYISSAKMKYVLADYHTEGRASWAFQSQARCKRTWLSRDGHSIQGKERDREMGESGEEEGEKRRGKGLSNVSSYKGKNPIMRAPT